MEPERRDPAITPSDATTATATLEALLAKTSRTFAIAIPCLPHPANKEVTIAYLLFRIADTIEDGKNLSKAEKVAAFDAFYDLLDIQGASTSLDLPRPPIDDPDHAALLDEVSLVVNSAASLREPVRHAIIRRARATIAGMKRFVAQSPDGQPKITSVAELRDYCYVVAGIVGELLTDVFVFGATWLSSIRPVLDQHARAFGEGLQLVNILKDSDDDHDNGRIFIPHEKTRPKLFELARQDLNRAEHYVQALKQADAPPGYIAFTEIPLRLAWRTLECVELDGPGSKVPREEVMSIMAELGVTSPQVSDSETAG